MYTYLFKRGHKLVCCHRVLWCRLSGFLFTASSSGYFNMSDSKALIFAGVVLTTGIIKQLFKHPLCYNTSSEGIKLDMHVQKIYIKNQLFMLEELHISKCTERVAL